MPFSINTNIASLQAQNYLEASSNFQTQTIDEVTSGLRIVNSGDDAAGLAVANGLRSDEAVLTQGIANANNGISTLQTIDGGMNNISTLLDRARTLATESASGTFTGDRSVLNDEFQSVLSEIDRQAQSIGMNQGGQFAQKLMVFVGGGHDATGNTTDQAALTNGTVQVDLSKAAVDTKSLGLSTYTMEAGSSAAATDINTIVGSAVANGTAGAVDFNFTGAGFTNGITVTAQNVDNATSINDVVNDINTAIATAASNSGTSAAAFRAAGIQAEAVTQTLSNGTASTRIEFVSSSTAFSVSGGANSATAAENILGTTAQTTQAAASGAQTITLGWGGSLNTGDTQSLTISMTDANGDLLSTQVNLTSGETRASAIEDINTALAATNNDLGNLVATDLDPGAGGATTAGVGAITLMGASGTSFQVYAAADSGGTGLGVTTNFSGTTQNAFVTSAMSGTAGSVDILNLADAQQAVAALGIATSNLGAAQAAVGKGMNNFTYAVDLAQSQDTNEAATESQIRDANMAQEAANLTKAQILVQAGTAALAQANSAPQQLLTLLQQH